MAYCTFDQVTASAAPRGASALAERAPTPQHDPVGEPASFGPLEWSVVALARRDRMTSLRRPGRFTTVLRALFGMGDDLPLADPRLEALRRVSVWAWHHGYALPTSERRAFHAAGFGTDQYELLQTHIGATRGLALNRS